MNVRPCHKLAFPFRPIGHLHPRVEFLGIGSGNGMAFAASQAITAAVAGEAAYGQRSVLELEVDQPGRQAL